MDNAPKLAVFQAQVENLRASESSIRHVRRGINTALRGNDLPVSISFTKLYAVMFCAWAEAIFLKLVRTPHGFDFDGGRPCLAEKELGDFRWLWFRRFARHDGATDALD
jgi:hypothetical protein